MLPRVGHFILFLTVAHAAFGQEKNGKYEFLIDPSKPYVYIRYDHIAPRKPVQAGEPSTGLWLGTVNNCRVPKYPYPDSRCSTTSILQATKTTRLQA